MYRCLIVDDEMPARQELLYILRGIKGVEVVGEASHGVEALELIERLKPDIVFLDIQMPQMSGIEVARRLKAYDNPPIVIFVTAYDQFALKAFEVNAVDYLLKPISEERLEMRLKEIISSRDVGKDNNLDKLMEYLNLNNRQITQRLSLHHEDKLIPIDTKDIIYITIEDRNTVVFTIKGKFESNHTLNELINLLDETIFFRSHKSYIVNLNYIESIEPWFNSTYNINLKNEKEIIPVSRNYAKEFKKIMNIE